MGNWDKALDRWSRAECMACKALDIKRTFVFVLEAKVQEIKKKKKKHRVLYVVNKKQK